MILDCSCKKLSFLKAKKNVTLICLQKKAKIIKKRLYQRKAGTLIVKDFWGTYIPFEMTTKSVDPPPHIGLNIVFHLIHIWFKLAGWYESPIKSVVVTFPLDKIVFPTVTLCPRDSRPDRWGFAIKIFDHLNTDCESKRWDYVFNYRKKPPFRAILREFYFIIINLWLSICDPNCLLIQYH